MVRLISSVVLVANIRRSERSIEPTAGSPVLEGAGAMSGRSIAEKWT